MSKLHDILNKRASVEEKIAFYRQLRDNKALEEEFFDQKNAWVKTGKVSKLSSHESDEDFNQIWKKVAGNRFLHLVSRQIMRYAAIVVLTLSVGGVMGYLISQQTSTSHLANERLSTFRADKGSIAEVVLADGSIVRLNAQTSLTYREDPKTGHRLVSLEGEAYFNVVHDEERPFIVEAGDLTLIDLGTQFNVQAYSDTRYIETVLVEGKIEIHKQQKKKVTLIPGRMCEYSKRTGKFKVSAFDINKKPGWLSNKFVYSDERLERIMHDLELWYDFRVVFANKSLRNDRFNMNISRNVSVEQVLEMLRLNTNANFVMTQNSEDEKVITISK
ncbi:FecR family protein [Prolixibacteraceae bacterium JC049]|nr:FecR family protein [Prolixibacteraceae bacterium JC049]